MVVELRRHLVRIGTVESLCWASWGCWMITIWAFVGMGWAGSVSQRQTGLGRLQFEQMGRRAGSGSAVVVEEERWLVEFSFPGSIGGLLLYCFVLASYTSWRFKIL